MSTFPIPESAVPEMERLEQMNRDFVAMLPKEFAGTANLMVHPAAGIAAASALSVGLASHAMGVWIGAVTGASEAAQRLFSPDFGDFTGATQAKPVRETTAKRDAASTASLIAEVKTLARKLEKAEAKPAVVAATDPMGVEAAGVEAAPAGIQPEDFRQPASIERPEAADDLKAISGIGPKLEQVLNGLGIWTYGQIAGWTPEEVAWANDYLGFKGRIGRDDWIGQAVTLAGGNSAA
ncbi:NADH-ubiquinone dehydrogenase [Aminobacter sp. DSM 101952]|uniref:NADH-ubiquinone dehydrogenase n=1 Tax=Aminobacter sp. DSM 101952 TaxID=2735891 RepID=UPI0006FFB9F8|nr:NADH-ubiquinone dehydrogenase [Aminobacter sp. DSM 101952]KQU76228.1 NADH-ubiquinone dehydrogenase [Aminobacter sp. DSM 101952]